MAKKAISLILALILLISAFPLAANAVAPVGNPNGKVQAADAMIIYQQAQGKHPLF